VPNAREDIVAIEAAADLLARGLSTGDISALTDFVTDTTLVLPPARRTVKGQAVVEFWRNLATAMQSVRLLSTDIESIAEGVVRDTGTLSLRPKQREERNFFRYMMLWQKVGDQWTLASMTWNRDAPAAGTGSRPDRGGQGAASAGEM
jgi:ketosteroid isomerase-like protein